MSARRFRPRLQAGWALLETAVAMSLVGLLTVAVITTAGKATGRIEARHVLEDAERAEHALLGYARVHARLPEPEARVASTLRPGYLEGWLPASALGVSVSGRLRYVVEASLVDTPVPQSADPLALANGRTGTRAGANGLDLCEKLMRVERAGTALPGGMRLGFAVQQAASFGSGTPVETERAWLGDDLAGTPPADVRLGTRTRGPGELAAALGCIPRASQLAGSVRSTAAALDLLRIAKQETALRQLNLDLAQDSLTNLRWRLVNWSVGMEKFVFSLGLEALSARTTEVSYVTGALNVASLSGAIAGIAWLLDVTHQGIEKGKVGVEKSRAALAAAQAYEAQLQAEVDAQAQHAQWLQNAGLNP